MTDRTGNRSVDFFESCKKQGKVSSMFYTVCLYWIKSEEGCVCDTLHGESMALIQLDVYLPPGSLRNPGVCCLSSLVISRNWRSQPCLSLHHAEDVWIPLVVALRLSVILDGESISSSDVNSTSIEASHLTDTSVFKTCSFRSFVTRVEKCPWNRNPSIDILLNLLKKEEEQQRSRKTNNKYIGQLFTRHLKRKEHISLSLSSVWLHFKLQTVSFHLHWWRNSSSTGW